MSHRLEVSNLRVAYGGRGVLDVSELTAQRGDLVVVLGGAGSGKTTLAAALAGSVASRGKVSLDGRPLDGSPSQRRRRGLAVALREGGRLSGCSVAEALHLAARGSRRDAQALERFRQLGTRRTLLAQLLSGGEQQLLRVAAAWCAAPLVLVLDSPTVGLAADAAENVVALAREESARGTAVLWLEQDARAAPSPPSLALAAGKLSAIRPVAGEKAAAAE